MAPRDSSHWRLLAELLRPEARRLAGLGAALTGAAALPLVGPQLLRAFIDRAAVGAPLGALLGIAGAYVVLGVGAQSTTVVTTYAANRVAWTVTNALRERAVAHTLALDLAFHRDTTPGALIERVDGDATAIGRFFTDVVVKVIVGGLMLAGTLVLVALEDRRAGAALAVFALLAAVVIVRLRELAVPATAADRAAHAAVVGTIEERLAGAEDLRALGAGDHAVAKLEEASAAQLATARRAERRNPDDGVPVLRDIDLGVPAGARVGLVGQTGSGKTTLARLVLRLVDPTEGDVRLGGVDLRDVGDAALRNRVTTVTQEVQLFRATVRDNVTLFGAVSAADAEIAAVLAEVGLGPWLARLPAGLDATLGPGGAGLSAGEAQLLGLARVFLRDPGLVVLDEASSRVDPATQVRVEAATDRLLAGRTAVLIAHRLSSVLRCDLVVVLADGQIVEQGPPHELAADPGSVFAQLRAVDLSEVTS